MIKLTIDTEKGQVIDERGLSVGHYNEDEVVFNTEFEMIRMTDTEIEMTKLPNLKNYKIHSNPESLGVSIITDATNRRFNFPEILPTQKWNLIGYINGKHTNVYHGKLEDFKTLRFLGRSGDFYHVLGDDRTVLVCSLIFE